MKRKTVIESVKSGRGIKQMQGSIVRVNQTKTYNMVIDYHNQEQREYMEKNYAEIVGIQHPFNYYRLNRRSDNDKIETGLFMTSLKQEMHWLLKNFVEKEGMTVWSNKEVISGRRYNSKEQKRVDAGLAAMVAELAKENADKEM